MKTSQQWAAFSSTRSPGDILEQTHETPTSSSQFVHLVNCAVILSCWILLALLHRGKGLSWNLHKGWQYGFWAAQLNNHSSPINFVLHWLNYDLHRVMSTRASCLHEHGRWSVSVIGLNMCLFQFVLIYLFFNLKYIAVALFCVIWLKLKYSSFKRTFSTLLSATLLYHLEAAC